MLAWEIPVANTSQVPVHNVHRCEQRLAAVLLRGVEAEDLLHGVGAVIVRYKPSELFLGNIFGETFEGGIRLRIKIVDLRFALLILPQALVAGLRVFRNIG